MVINGKKVKLGLGFDVVGPLLVGPGTDSEDFTSDVGTMEEEYSSSDGLTFVVSII